MNPGVPREPQNIGYMPHAGLVGSNLWSYQILKTGNFEALEVTANCENVQYLSFWTRKVMIVSVHSLHDMLSGMNLSLYHTITDSLYVVFVPRLEPIQDFSRKLHMQPWYRFVY